MDLGWILQAILFGIFGLLTAALAAVIGPTYDGLFVPEMSRSSLYPSLFPAGGASAGFLSKAASYSSYLLANLVDPAVAFVALAVGLLYLFRSVFARFGPRLEGLVARLILSVLLANFTLPLASAILSVAGATFPVIAGFDGGQWQHWENLAGYGEFGFSWDNGALAFVLTFVLFGLVLLLSIAVAFRDALLAVLLVLLPIFSLLGPLPYFGSLARRGWLLFVELAFLPCVLVVPLELAVGSSSILLLVAFLSIALGSPYLITVAGTHLSALGFPAVGSAITGGVQRGLAASTVAVSNTVRPPAMALANPTGPVRTLGAAAMRAGGPAAGPLFVSELVGHGAHHLVRHLSMSIGGARSAPTFPRVSREAPHRR